MNQIPFDEVADALTRGAKEMNRSKRALAKALNMDPADLSPSHLRNPKRGEYICRWLVWRLRRANLLTVASQLRLDTKSYDAKDYRALQSLSATLVQLVLGFTVSGIATSGSTTSGSTTSDVSSPGILVSTRQEAIDMSRNGVDSYDEGNWEEAASLLQSSWDFLSKSLSYKGQDLRALIRVGTQLGGWHVRQGKIDEAVELTRNLNIVLEHHHDRDDKILEALGLFKKGASLITYLQNSSYAWISIRLNEQACQLFEEAKSHPGPTVAAWRDQARPYLKLAFAGLQEQPDPQYVEAAIRVLDTSETAAGGNQPHDDLCHEWLLTRLTHIGCFITLQEDDKAQRLWDDTLNRDPIIRLVQEEPALYLPTVAAIQVGLCLRSKDLDKVAEAAKAYQGDPLNANEPSRLHHMAKVEQWAIQGKMDRLRHAF